MSVNQKELLQKYKKNCPRLNPELVPANEMAKTPDPYCLTAHSALEEFYRQNTLTNESKVFTEGVLGNCEHSRSGRCAVALTSFRNLEQYLNNVEKL